MPFERAILKLPSPNKSAVMLVLLQYLRFTLETHVKSMAVVDFTDK